MVEVVWNFRSTRPSFWKDGKYNGQYIGPRQYKEPAYHETIMVTDGEAQCHHPLTRTYLLASEFVEIDRQGAEHEENILDYLKQTRPSTGREIAEQVGVDLHLVELILERARLEGSLAGRSVMEYGRAPVLP